MGRSDKWKGKHFWRQRQKYRLIGNQIGKLAENRRFFDKLWGKDEPCPVYCRLTRGGHQYFVLHQVNKYFRDLRVKLRSGIALDLRQRHFFGQPLAVYPIFRHGVKRIGYREYAGDERDVFSL